MKCNFTRMMLPTFLLLAGTPQLLHADDSDRKPYWQDIQTVEVNKEYPRTDFMTFTDRTSALNSSYEESPNYRSLNGTWKFYFVDSYKQLPDNITDPSVDASQWSDIQVPGNTPYKKYGKNVLFPKADSNMCTLCGACAKVCPTGAIPVKEPKKTDTKKCIGCMKCVRVCKQNARSVNSLKMKMAESKLKKVCQSDKKAEIFL